MLFSLPEKIKLPNSESENNLKEKILKARYELLKKKLKIEKDKNEIIELKSKILKIKLETYKELIEMDGSLYTKRIYLPTKEYPEINFVGLILGPKGSTLKQIERMTKCRIYIKGFYKDKNTEPLHCYITAETIKALTCGKSVIEGIVEQSVFNGSNNLLKEEQLKDVEINRCENNDWEMYYKWWWYWNKSN